MIQVEKLSYSFPTKELYKKVSFTLEDGQHCAFIGSNGTGKTTLFLCNCWREKYNQDKEFGGNGLGEILGDRMIGLYYKVDPAFVTAMEGNGREKDFWNGIFCTYLSLEIIKELFSLLLRVEECGKITKDDVRRVSRRYYNSVRGEEAISVEIEELLSDCENAKEYRKIIGLHI